MPPETLKLELLFRHISRIDDSGTDDDMIKLVRQRLIPLRSRVLTENDIGDDFERKNLRSQAEETFSPVENEPGEPSHINLTRKNRTNKKQYSMNLKTLRGKIEETGNPKKVNLLSNKRVMF